MRLICNIIFVSITLSGLVRAEEKPVKRVDELTAAYQREILFLSTYKKELKNKLKLVETSLGQKVTQAQSDLESLEKKWLSLQTSNELLVQKLGDVERDFENRKENQEVLEITLKQAKLGQKKAEEGETSESLLEQVTSLFATASTQLTSLSDIQKESGEFYLKNGEQAQGTIYQVGSIARFAQKDGKMAALYPSGAGTFRVWTWLGDEALAIANGELPQNLQFFMYDNPEKEFIAQSEKTTLDVIQSGGLIGWIIVFMGLFALIISGLRFVLLRQARCADERLIEKAISKINSNKIEEAQHIFIGEKSAVSRVLSQTLSFLQTEPEKVEDAVQEAIIKESQLIDRFGVVILVIASVAPLMGLLGTVTGMISTFDIITLYGTGNPKLLSGGISEALVTTMLGLIVAIPALLMGQYLGAKNEKIKSDMEKWALATCNAFNNRGV